MQCCCEIETPVCEDTCRCASSYLVEELTGQYSYIKDLDFGSQWDCTKCPNYSCYDTWHEVTLQWQLVAPMVLTEITVPGSSPPECCYRAEGTVQVTGTVRIYERYRCGGEDCADWEETHTFNVDRETCVCLTVKCGTFPDCQGLHAGAGWIHQVEIGDFVVECSVELRGYADCDRCYDDPPPDFAPLQVRCTGGVVCYKTPLSKCHDQLLASDWSCLGFRPYLDDCPFSDPDFPENDCFRFSGGRLNYPILGPFGLYPADECSVGQDDVDCQDIAVSGPWLYSNILPGNVQPVCGSFSFTEFLCQGTVRRDWGQSSCTPMGAPIVYS